MFLDFPSQLKSNQWTRPISSPTYTPQQFWSISVQTMDQQIRSYSPKWQQQIGRHADNPVDTWPAMRKSPCLHWKQCSWSY